jgi:diguanylate cyclase (GGDEF)-like protein
MRQLPLALRRYLVLLNVACLALLFAQIVPFLAQGGLGRMSASVVAGVGVFIVLALVGHHIVLHVNRSVSQDLATSVHVAAVLLFPLPLALLVTFVSSMSSEALRRESPLFKRAFNTSHPTLTVGLSAMICSLGMQPTHLLLAANFIPAIPSLALLAALFYILDVTIMVGVFAFLQGRSPWSVWWQDYRPALLPELAGSSIGVVGTILWEFNPIALGLVVLPVVALRVAFTAIAQADERSEALQRRGRQLEAVLTAGQALRLQHTQSDLLQPLAEAARTIVSASFATGYLRDEENPTLLKRVITIPCDASSTGPACLSVSDYMDSMREEVLADVGRVIPLLLEPDGMGVAGLLLLGGEALSVGDNERDSMAILANQAAIALLNAHLHERALAQASQDGLTGLLNHRAFQTRLDEEVARAQRCDHALALMMIDMDDFGIVNNSYGHQVGDATLAAIAVTLRETVRLADVAARYGGDEFVVILPETDEEGAFALAERVRRAIAMLVVADTHLSISVNASIGVAMLSLHAQTREELIRAADQAAYAAKHAGKGRVGRPQDAQIFLDRDPARLAEQIEHANLATVAALAAAVDAKDPYTQGHSQRVSLYATALAAGMRLSVNDISRIALAGLLHDVGKIGVPDAILTKAAKLSPDEYAIIMQHSVIGEHMLASAPFLRDILPAVRHHHERWDGKGYPDSLGGSAIPLDAAILMVADSLDAMTSSRTYRAALSLDEARLRIQDGKGTQFHPSVVAAFEQVLEDGRLALVPSPMPGQSTPLSIEPADLRINVAGDEMRRVGDKAKRSA